MTGSGVTPSSRSLLSVSPSQASLALPKDLFGTPGPSPFTSHRTTGPVNSTSVSVYHDHADRLLEESVAWSTKGESHLHSSSKLDNDLISGTIEKYLSNSSL